MSEILVLLSGGLDSTACVAYYLDRSYDVRTIWVDYGQVTATPERNSAESVSNYYRVPLEIVEIDGLTWNTRQSGDEYVGRNALLAMLALATFNAKSGLISLGIHDHTSYVDCSTIFQDQISQMIAMLSYGTIDVDFPFGTWTKHNIAEFCVRSNVPVALTYSCNNSPTVPCNRCGSCVERQGVENILAQDVRV